MAKGGARGRSGPAPDPNSLAQVDGEWTVLPASGRVGDLPTWPLADPLVREIDIWEAEWTRPQAVMWDRHGQEIEVAMYVRTLIAAESHDAPAATRTLLKQLQEALGLSMPGMLRNRWKIGDAVIDAPEGAADEPENDVRGRLTVVAGGGA